MKRYTPDDMPEVGELTDIGRCVWTSGNKAAWSWRDRKQWSVYAYGPRGGCYPVGLNHHQLTLRQARGAVSAIDLHHRTGEVIIGARRVKP